MDLNLSACVDKHGFCCGRPWGLQEEQNRLCWVSYGSQVATFDGNSGQSFWHFRRFLGIFLLVLNIVSGEISLKNHVLPPNGVEYKLIL